MLPSGRTSHPWYLIEPWFRRNLAAKTVKAAIRFITTADATGVGALFAHASRHGGLWPAMTMEQINLAAAILRWASPGAVKAQLEPGEHLTNEEAINLADWLQCESPINEWRRIYLIEVPELLSAPDRTHRPADK